ncbi:hypothetical protein [Cohnella zeiphila]|nr:hypothetical protein [Cohnella zeiphila]
MRRSGFDRRKTKDARPDIGAGVFSMAAFAEAGIYCIQARITLY